MVETGKQQLVAYDLAGKANVIASDIAGNDVVVARNGNVYVTNPPAGASNEPSKVWLIRPDGTKIIVDTGLRYANGVGFPRFLGHAVQGDFFWGCWDSNARGLT